MSFHIFQIWFKSAVHFNVDSNHHLYSRTSYKQRCIRTKKIIKKIVFLFFQIYSHNSVCSTSDHSIACFSGPFNIGIFYSRVPPFPSGGWIWSVDMKHAYEMRAVKKSGGPQKVSLIKATHIRGPVRWWRVETQLPTQACQSQQARGP